MFYDQFRRGEFCFAPKEPPRNHTAHYSLIIAFALQMIASMSDFRAAEMARISS